MVVIDGVGLTVTVTVVGCAQTLSGLITEYVVVVVGFATTEAPVVALKPVEGDQT